MENLAQLIGLALAGGTAYRLRGYGLFMSGTFGRRLFWCFCIAILCLSLGAGLTASLGAAVGAFAGLMIPHGKYFAINGKAKNAMVMSLIGVARLGLIGLPLLLATPDAMALPIIGALQGPAYYAGYLLRDKLGLEGIAWGEALTGAYIFVAVYIILGGQ